MVSPASRAAYAACERRAQSHYENFPVASLLLPRRMRPHVAALYAFARVADDFADEGDLPAADRLRLLDGWSRRLEAAADRSLQPARTPGEPSDSDAIFLALGETLRTCSLPVDLFADLLSAFRQDVTTTRYAHWDALFDYARRSANPVGRLVLRIGGYRDPQLDAWSDAVCTALQFTNFWQDLEADLARGRIYLPQSELARQGQLSAITIGTLRSALRPAIQRTYQLFAAGRPLCDAVTGRLRYELRATWLGGRRILDRIDAQRCGEDVSRPSLRFGDFCQLAWAAVTWAPR